jgi:Ca-activated chloride channel family protein
MPIGALGGYYCFKGLTVTKLQKIIIIIAAFGIVSLVLTQTQTSAHLNVQTTPNLPAGADAYGTSTSLTLSTTPHNNQDSNKQTNAQNQLQEPITNIYQTESGSFYFIESTANPFQNADAANSEANQTNSIKKMPQYSAANLLSTHADIRVTGPIARTRLTQVFKNTSEHMRSGIYVFPLPQDAAVDHLLMTVGNRKIEGQIKRKAIAKQMFTQAKAQGKKASLVAQIRPNMFSNQIANIPPNSELSVTIEYQQFIVQDKHRYSLRLPLSITPRYSPKHTNLEVNDINAENTLQNNEPATFTRASLGFDNKDQQAEVMPSEASGKLAAKTTINISLNTGLPVQHITSEHHPIKVTNTYSTQYEVSLDTQQPANKDFVLNWQMQTAYSIQASHFTYPSDEYEYGLITLMPPSADQLDVNRNLVFVLDVSGSMVGESIEQAKQALALAINDLKEDDFFNLVAFSSNATRMWSQSQKASQNAKNEALTFIYGLEANGGTEIKKALDMAFSIPEVTEASLLDESAVNNGTDYLNQILFITDGSVGNEDELMRTIYQGLGDYRLFTVGIGSAPNAHFMTEAASAGKGTFTFIGDTSKVKPKMARLLDKLKKPALTNLQLNIKDLKQAFGFEVYPSKLPDLYADEPLVITYRQKIELNTNQAPSKFSPSFAISGEYLSPTANGKLKKRKWSSQLPAQSADKEQGIHKYWARLKIKDLHQQLNMRALHTEGFKTLKQNVEDAITEVALSHHLVSKYTSLIAIEEKTPEQMMQMAAQNKNPHLRQYAQAQLPQTATASGLLALIGSILLGTGLLLLRFLQSRNKYACSF